MSDTNENINETGTTETAIVPVEPTAEIENKAEVVAPPAPKYPKPEVCRPVEEIEPFNWQQDFQNKLQRTPWVFERRGGKDTVYYLMQEENFVPADGEVVKSLNEKEAELVGTEEIACPLCNNKQSLTQLRKGEKTGIRVLWPVPCFCMAYRQFYREWAKPGERADRVPRYLARSLARAGLEIPQSLQGRLLDHARHRVRSDQAEPEAQHPDHRQGGCGQDDARDRALPLRSPALDG